MTGPSEDDTGRAAPLRILRPVNLVAVTAPQAMAGKLGPPPAGQPARPVVRWRFVHDPGLLAALADTIWANVSLVDGNDRPQPELTINGRR